MRKNEIPQNFTLSQKREPQFLGALFCKSGGSAVP